MSNQVRPIDAEATYQAMVKTIVNMMRTKRWMRSDKDNEDEILLVIQNATTLDYAPVKHGEWIEGHCSVCGAEATYNDIDEAIFDYDWEENLRYSHTETRREYHETPFCHNCGAKMDGGKEDA